MLMVWILRVSSWRSGLRAWGLELGFRVFGVLGSSLRCRALCGMMVEMCMKKRCSASGFLAVETFSP